MSRNIFIATEKKGVNASESLDMAVSSRLANSDYGFPPRLWRTDLMSF